jgi:RHS repeat-associated protein
MNKMTIYYVTNANGAVVQELSYDAWGRLRNPATQQTYTPGNEPNLYLGRGYTGHEHLPWFGPVNMNARLYDPALGRFLSSDPYVQNPFGSQNFNRYSYAMNNPLVYTDPNGEIVWIPIVIGAIIGGASGYMIGHSKGATGWDMAGYSGEAMLKGAGIGALSGFVGGGLGSAIGGGWGAVAGGVASSGINTALNGGDLEQTGISMLAGAALAYGAYELTSYIGWSSGGNRLGKCDISYKQYKTMQADFQRSRFWHKEYGGFLMNDGTVQRFPASWRHSHGIEPPGGNGIRVPNNVRAMYHTHWDAPGKIIWVDAYGNRVDNSTDLSVLATGRQTTTARGHGAYDFIHIDSYVVNRYEVTFNIGNTHGLTTINDPFLRYFPWFYIWRK